jgi:hypothetical protein
MPFLYTSCVLDCALRFLMIFLLIVKKINNPRALFILYVLLIKKNILELFQCWKAQGQRQSKEATWKVIPTLLIWSIWRERNQRLFENCESNVLLLKSSSLRTLLDCAVTFVSSYSSFNFVDLVNFLDF